MIYEGIIINLNHDLAEVCLFPVKKNDFAFLPERILDAVRLGQRLIFKIDNDQLELYGI